MNQLNDVRRILDHLYNASRLLLRPSEADEAVPDLLKVLVPALSIRSAVLIETRSRDKGMRIWHAPSTSDEELAPVKERAQEFFSYMTESGTADVMARPLEKMAVEALESVPFAEQGKIVTLPLAVDQEAPFGIFVLDCKNVDELKVSVLNAVGSHLALALDRNFRMATAREACIRERNAREEAARQERRLAEEAQRLAALSVSEKRFRSLAELLPQFVWTAQGDGRLEYCNSRWLSFTGFTLEQTLGFGWLAAIHPDDLVNIEVARVKAVKNEDTFTVEHRIRSKDGSYSWFLCRALPERDEDQRIVRWLGTSTDINQRKHMEMQLAVAKAGAEEANRAKSAFLANMSHEIRTPLSAMTGFAELLKDDTLTREESMSFLEVISRNGKDLADLINDILDLSKVEAERLDVESARVSVSEILHSVMNAVKIKATEKNINLHLRADPLVPEFITSDPIRLKQILFNIVGNAVKFTQQGSVELALEYFPEVQMLEFEVTDTGIGISAEAQKRIFQPFVQADNTTTRKFGGTGLGLVLARKLAIALGGNLVLKESIMDVKTTFSITVATGPVKEGYRLLNFGKDSKRVNIKDLKSYSNLDGMRILVAEDALDNRLLIERMLESDGATVSLVENGKEAVKEALQSCFDVVLMDIQMPVLDGYKATEELRRLGYNKPIIALTAHAMKGERSKSLRSGCNEHLTKPINHLSLLKALRRAARPELLQ